MSTLAWRQIHTYWRDSLSYLKSQFREILGVLVGEFYSSARLIREEQMQIQVKCGCKEEEDCSEWAIVEMQGVVEIQPAFLNSLQNLEIGRLCRNSSQSTYKFTVGYHELSGSRIPLKKPLLVLKKKKHIDPTEPNSSKAEMEVIGIIRHRILFKTRPKALISSVQPFVKGKAAEASSAVQ